MDDVTVVTRNDDGSILFEGADIKWRNFEGREGKFTPEGYRSFHLLLDEDLANTLEKEGWNITWPKAKEDEDEEDRWPRVPSVDVRVRYDKGRPPKIVVITSAGQRTLTQDTVEMLDFSDIQNIDMLIRPNKWREEHPSHKAYLRTMYVTLNEDALERKYAQRDDD